MTVALAVIFIGFVVGKLLFEQSHELAQREGNAQVNHTDDDKTFKAEVGCTLYGKIRGHKVAYKEG